jgi:hypothetical protein
LNPLKSNAVDAMMASTAFSVLNLMVNLCNNYPIKSIFGIIEE